MTKAKPKTKKATKASVSAAQELRDQINKAIGYEVVRTGDHPMHNLPRLSTGSLLLDRHLGGGYKWARMIEMYGPESAGKTTLAYMAMQKAIEAIQDAENGLMLRNDEAGVTKWFIEQMRRDMRVAYIDIEGSFDPVYAAHTAGLNIDYVDHVRVGRGDDALNVIDLMLRSNQYAYITCDTVAALVPKAVWEKKIGEQTMAQLAQLMSQGLGKLTAVQGITIVHWLNQVREKVGQMFGDNLSAPGGRAMKHYADHRFLVTRGEKVETEAEDQTGASSNRKIMDHIGYEMRVKVVKDKVGRMQDGKLRSMEQTATILPYRKAVPGVDSNIEIQRLLTTFGYIDGTTWRVISLPAVGDHKKFEYKQSGVKWIEPYLADNPEVRDHALAVVLKELHDERFGESAASLGESA